MSFFEHIAATDDSERVARRKASVIAAQRFQNQFGAFLKGASSKEDFQARLALIDSDIKEMTYDVAEEYGGDPQVIESAVRRHFLGAAHTVEERDGKYFVVEDGGAETVAGPFDERQEAQNRASELDELEPLEKEAATAKCDSCNKDCDPSDIRDNGSGMKCCATCETEQGNRDDGSAPDEDWLHQGATKLAMDNEQWRQAIQGLLSDIESMYGETPSDAEYLTGSSADEDLLSGLRDFVEYGHQGPNPAQTIKGIFSDINSMWGYGGSITDYAKDVLQNEWSDDTFADLGGNEGEEHYGSTKVAVRRPKMCPYHSELTEASLQAGEPQYAAFSSLVGGNSHCKGSFDGKCNFKPEMVTQEFWDAKAEQAAERKQLREQQQQEVVEIAEEPIVEEPVAENTELTDEISEAPSAVGEMSLEGESVDMGEEAMAMTANQKDRSNPPAARNHPPDPGLVGERPTRQYQPGNPVAPGETPVAEKYPSPRRLVDTAPGGAPPQLHPEEIVGAGIPLDEDPFHQLTEEEVRRIRLMREKAAKFASLKQAKDCDCWEGYKRVPGTKPCAPGSCEKCDSSSKKSAWKDVTHNPFEASRRQAEVAWDGGGANKNERGNWAWGHQEPKADESGLDDAPSGPAMDKTRWQPAALDPNGKGNLKPVDTEYPGTPNPTIQQVLWERREDEDVYGQQEFGDGTNSVTEQQELPAADETGLTTEKNLDQGSQGGTFPNEGQANPVTSKVAEIIGENAGRALYEDAVDRNMTVHDRLMEIYDQLEGMQGGEGLTEQAAADVQQAMALIDNALADTYHNAEPTGDHEMMDYPDDPYDHGAGGGDPDEGY